MKINIPRMLIGLREGLDRGRIAPWSERMVFRAARRGMQSPALFRLGARMGRLLQRPFLHEGRLRRLPLLLREVDGHARSSRGGGEDLLGALEGTREAMTTRAEFLGRVRTEMAKTRGLFPAMPAPRPGNPREAAEVVRRQLAERWPQALERFRAEFERVAGVFHRVPSLVELPALLGADRGREACARGGGLGGGRAGLGSLRRADADMG